MAVAASKERSSHSISDTFDNNKRVIVYSDTDWGGGHSTGKTAEFVDFGLSCARDDAEVQSKSASRST